MAKKAPSPNKNISFGLRKMQTEQFAIIADAFVANGVLKQKITMDCSVDKEHLLIAISPTFSLLSNDTTFLTIKGTFTYAISPNSWGTFTVNNKTTIPVDFLRHITITAIGALRGILHAKTENTPYNEYFIPTVNVEQLVTADLVVD